MIAELTVNSEPFSVPNLLSNDDLVALFCITNYFNIPVTLLAEDGDDFYQPISESFIQSEVNDLEYALLSQDILVLLDENDMINISREIGQLKDFQIFIVSTSSRNSYSMLTIDNLQDFDICLNVLTNFLLNVDLISYRDEVISSIVLGPSDKLGRHYSLEHFDSAVQTKVKLFYTEETEYVKPEHMERDEAEWDADDTTPEMLLTDE